ncbi:MAG: molybdenum cofactor biosysynthesis protein [Gammaproteobacteria bacterium]|nr:molybdenum cofactor biosysynthesis protein [Pseudomonadota bacterium]TDJ12338.1 MAG: molybdenum cofactor biosysynthesis protein [Gammaproteobacteria bacterium]
MGRLVGLARRDKKRAEMEILDDAEISEQTGVANDFRGKPGKRQVTVISAEAWAAACEELGQEIPWTTRRANLLTEDIELPQRTGDVIEIAGVRLLVTMKVDPCSRMDEQFQGLRSALIPEWRGGVACTVLKGGPVRLGDSVSVLSADS